MRDQATVDLRYVFESGMVDTTLSPFRNEFVMKAIDGFREQRLPDYRVDPHRPPTFEPLNNPKTARWQAHTFGPQNMPIMNSWFGCELARIVVPDGDVGLIRSVEQVLYDQDGNYYPTGSDYWGSPYPVDPDVANTEWYLNIQHFEGLTPPQYALSSLIVPLTREAFPGAPYPELATIQGLWLPANSPNTRVKLIVPGASIIRFYFYSPPTVTWRWRVAGRLQAQTQTAYCKEAEANARRTI